MSDKADFFDYGEVVGIGDYLFFTRMNGDVPMHNWGIIRGVHADYDDKINYTVEWEDGTEDVVPDVFLDKKTLRRI